MNYELLLDIIEQLSVINPWKARKLDLLVGNHFTTRDEDKKKEIAKKIDRFIYNLFASSLTRESKNDFFNTGAVINEECYEIEKSEEDRWFITTDGARRFIPTDDGLKEANYIPRDYKKGFHLVDRGATCDMEAGEIMRELSFLKKHQSALNSISGLMDHKLELITNNYNVKKGIPRFFVEMLIDYLELSRLPKEEKKNNK